MILRLRVRKAMNSQIIELWKGSCREMPHGSRAFLTAALLPPSPDGGLRPAILVVPGGGYGGVCFDSEGAPIARRFNALGYSCFILTYRCGECGRSPSMFQDAVRAVRLIRARAAEFGIDPEQVASCGFSAGGHLAAALGTNYCDGIEAEAGDGADRCDWRVNAMILCYAVLSGREDEGHPGSLFNCFGLHSGENPTEAQYREFAVWNHLDERTAPAFVWHTAEDQVVSPRGAQLLTEAMRKRGLVCSEHSFPFGDHGMLAAIGTDAEVWMSAADQFMQMVYRRRRLTAEEFHVQYTNAEQFRREQ